MIATIYGWFRVRVAELIVGVGQCLRCCCTAWLLGQYRVNIVQMCAHGVSLVPPWQVSVEHGHLSEEDYLMIDGIREAYTAKRAARS